MGDFTVADAVFIEKAVKDASNIFCSNDPHAAASLEIVHGVIEDFICCAEAASAIDARARTEFVQWGNRIDYLCERDVRLLANALAADMRDLTGDTFESGSLFGGANADPDAPYAEIPWWELRANNLSADGLAVKFSQ